MSEQENTQILRSAYEAFKRGDVETVLSNLTEDVEWTEQGPADLITSGTSKGKAQVAAWFGILGNHFDFDEFEPMEYIAQDDKVVAVVRVAITAKDTGKKATMHEVHVATFNEGKLARFRIFLDTAAAAALKR